MASLWLRAVHTTTRRLCVQQQPMWSSPGHCVRSAATTTDVSCAVHDGQSADAAAESTSGLVPCSIWLVDKPVGVTSHDVCRQVRLQVGLPGHVPRGKRSGASAGQPRVKVGHTGTLDPFFGGLMIVLVGRATRLARFFSSLGKEYEATIKLGVTSASHDLETDVQSPGGPIPVAALTQDRIDRVLAGFVGTYAQRVPLYSAVSVEGRRLYEMSRANEAPATSELPIRDVTITQLERLDHGEVAHVVRVRVVCGKGTYIRALARDIGDALGCGALCASLRRTKIGELSVDDAVAPSAVSLHGGLPLAEALTHIPLTERDAAEAIVHEHLTARNASDCR